MQPSIPWSVQKVATPVPHERVERLVVDGFDLAFAARGDGPAVTLLHGFPMDRTLWGRLAAALSGWRCLTPDLPGFGLSDRDPANASSMAGYADRIAALLDRLEVAQTVLGGLSMGGYVAFEFWRRHRHRVRALILLNTRADADSPDGRRKRDDMMVSIRRDGVEALAAQMVPRMVAPRPAGGGSASAELRAMILKQRPEGLLAAVRAMRDRSDSTPLLGGIDIPTLVVAGSDDGIVSLDDARALTDAIPGARLEVIPDAGHVAPLEQPDAVHQVVSRFLADLP